MNRLGVTMGGLPFALHGQHAGLLPSQGNVTLGPTGASGNLGSFALPNNVFPEGITLFSSTGGGVQLGQLHSLPTLQHHGDAAKLQGLTDLHAAGSPATRSDALRSQLARPARSNDGNSGKSSSAYASRHQAAEQRRRTRINERLDLLRKMVPHSDRANTASFLEEVLKYIDTLKSRVTELETALAALKASGKSSAAPTGPAPAASLTGAAGGSSGLLRADSAAAGAEHRTLGSAGPSGGVGPSSAAALGSNGGGVSVFCLQQLQQQQQLQQLIQQQHDAALMAQLQEEQQQKAALLAAQQMRQQQEMAVARQANLADLATQLGLRTVPGISPTQTQQGSKLANSMEGLGSMLSSHGMNKEHRVSTMLLPGNSVDLRTGGQMSHTAAGATTTLHILPVQQLQLHGAVGDMVGGGIGGEGTNGSSAAAVTAAEAARKAGSGSSPVSSEESGVPLKKRKVLLL